MRRKAAIDRLSGMDVVTIWLLLLLAAVAALAGLALPRGVHRPSQVSAWLAANARRKDEDLQRRAAEAAEQIRYAEEVAVAARGAAQTAERRRAECQEAQGLIERTWAAYQKADAALTRARQAAVWTSLDAVDHEERRRALRRGAQAAYRRGDLSDEQLLDALTHRNGWDPALHPVEQELVLARAAVKHRFAAYQKALDAESDAWRAADIATAAVRSLRLEVMTAATRADAARAAVPAQVRPAVRRQVPVHA